MKKIVLVLIALMAAFCLAASAGTARAATNSISIASGTLVFGSQVTFAVTAVGNQQPALENTCFQNGVEVLDQWEFWTFGADPSWGTFTLGPTALWSGGAADCIGYLVKRFSNGNIQRTASVSYGVTA